MDVKLVAMMVSSTDEKQVGKKVLQSVVELVNMSETSMVDHLDWLDSSSVEKLGKKWD
jgi:hypothetical protein